MLDRTTAPPFNKGFSFTLLDPVRITLSNNLTIHFIRGGEQKVTKIELLFPAGRWVESPWGVSHFTAHLLTKGTSQKNSYQIAQIFDYYGAHVDVNPGLDVVSIAIYSLTENLAPVLQLVSEILQEAVFPEKELEQSKRIFLENLKVNNEKTNVVASKIFRRNLFGENHPYGKELDEDDVEKIQRNDLVSFYSQTFLISTAIVSGYLDSRAEEIITKALAQLTVCQSSKKINNPSAGKTAGEYMERKNSLQSSLRLGRKTVSRSDKDYARVLFLNHIFGGYFGSRLMKNIREEKGLSYGIYSSIHALLHESFVVIGADVNKKNREVAFHEIRKELTRLSTEKIPDEELDTARNHFTGSLQAEISTPFAHADKIRTILLFDLKKTFYNDLLSEIEKISAADLMKTAEVYFLPESFLEVSVG